MKKYIYLSAAAMTLLAASCSNDDQANGASDVDNTGKTRIALSAGDDQNSFVVTRAGFTNQTRIVARIVSDERAGSGKKVVKTVLSAAAGGAGADGFSTVGYETGMTRYWDDAFGRKSILSVYAVAVPNAYGTTDSDKLKVTDLKGGDTWETPDGSDDNKITWSVNASQNADLLNSEDLTYSNNIQAGDVGGNGVYTWSYTSPTGYPEERPSNAVKHTVSDATDGRLYFTQDGVGLNVVPSDAAGHFDKGQMEFRHALSRVRVNIIAGTGYDESAEINSLQLLNQVVQGDFDIKTASWDNKKTATTVTMAEVATVTDKLATYEAQMLPGYQFADNANNELVVVVGSNTYYITNAQLRTALTGKTGINADFTTEVGKRYVFDVTLAKSQIQNITATVVDWNNVEAANTNVDNSHYKFTFYKNGDNVTTDVNLYKYEQTLTSLATGGSYSAAAVAAEDPSVTYSAVNGFALVDGKTYFTTSEYYKDNQTAYHFRAINNAAKAQLNDTELSSKEDQVYFTMTYGTDTENTNDYVWGAPMKTGLSSDKLSYSTSNGYLDCIEKGIVAANTNLEQNYINLTQVHMMSQLVIKLTSVSTDANAKVNLAGATVKITKFSKTGTVNMGSGLITPSTSYGDMDTPVTVTTVDGVTSCKINVIPQSLVRNDDEHRTDADYVGITIHTADNNEYYIVKRLSDIVGTAGSQITNMQTADGKITRWYPGHKYIYTFNITKTEIKNITATIVGWNEVNAGNTDLDLEK